MKKFYNFGPYLLHLVYLCRLRKIFCDVTGQLSDSQNILVEQKRIMSDKICSHTGLSIFTANLMENIQVICAIFIH